LQGSYKKNPGGRNLDAKFQRRSCDSQFCNIRRCFVSPVLFKSFFSPGFIKDLEAFPARGEGEETWHFCRNLIEKRKNTVHNIFSFYCSQSAVLTKW
jgi:hypothetical protein